MVRSLPFVSTLFTMFVYMMFLAPPAILAAKDHQASGRIISRTSDDDDLTDLELQSLESIRQIDDYPMYMMTYYGAYEIWGISNQTAESEPGGCSAIVALHPDGDVIRGGNWDYTYTISVILFTDPPDGFASVSLGRGWYVDAYFKNPSYSNARKLLYYEPNILSIGMNEYGVATSAMITREGDVGFDPNKTLISYSVLIRLVLDYARDLDEAISIASQYNVLGDPDQHHMMISDSYGNSAIIEWYDNKMHVIRNVEPWQVMTNFMIKESAPDSIGNLLSCTRYRTAYNMLRSYNGLINEEIVMDVLEAINPRTIWGDAVDNTSQWSTVFNQTTGEFRVVTGGKYDQVHTFHLPMIADLANIKTAASPTRLAAGGRMRVVATINNLSPRPSSATRINFYLSNRRRPGKKAIRIGSRRLPSIESEGKKIIRLRIDLPDDIEPGEYYLISCLNENGRNNDDNEKNNVSVYKRKVSIR